MMVNNIFRIIARMKSHREMNQKVRESLQRQEQMHAKQSANNLRNMATIMGSATEAKYGVMG